MTFQEMGLSDAVLRALEEAGFSEPTPIQEQVIPLQIGHNDVIGQAQTGTGKTAAFGIPLIERLSPRQRDDGKHTTDALIQPLLGNWPPRFPKNSARLGFISRYLLSPFMVEFPSNNKSVLFADAPTSLLALQGGCLIISPEEQLI